MYFSRFVKLGFGELGFVETGFGKSGLNPLFTERFTVRLVGIVNRKVNLKPIRKFLIPRD